MADVGRPYALTPDLKQEVLAALSRGLPRWAAADLVGVHRETINNEAKRDIAFFDALKKAEAKCMDHHITHVYNHAERWQASMTFMERKWPKEWGRKVHIETQSLPGDSIGTVIQGELGGNDDADIR